MDLDPTDKAKFLEAFQRWEQSHEPVRQARQRVFMLEEQLHKASSGRHRTDPEGNLERGRLERADKVATMMEDLAQAHVALSTTLFEQAQAMHSVAYWGFKIIDALEGRTTT